MQLIYRYRFYILATFFILNVLACWPGFIQPDSANQYAQAVSGNLSDHHPPLMTFIWGLLDKVFKGQGSMYAIQMTMLYLGVAILLLCVDYLPYKKKWPIFSLVLLIFPIYPQILLYSSMLVKDMHFCFSLLLSSAILAYYTVSEKPVPVWAWLVILPLIFYSGAVKYQGKFCMLVPVVWSACLILKNANLWKKIALGLMVYVAFYAGIAKVNDLLVSSPSKNYSWQFVKLYDLAAISIALDRDLIPEYNRTESYTYEKLVTRFEYPAVDPYIFSKDNIFQVTRSEENMGNLCKLWWRTIIKHPYLYLKHRSTNIGHALVSRPGHMYVEKFMSKLPQGSVVYKFINTSVGGLFYIFMSHLLIVLLGLIYFIMALFNWRSSSSAKVLLGLTSPAMIMIAILFFMSMAGTPRYTYISVLMINVSHIFAYVVAKEKKYI